MKYFSMILLLALSLPAFAGHGSNHIFLCNVVSFDKTEVKGQCDPGRPKRIMKIPREWLDEDEKVRVNAKVRFTIDHKQLDQWMAMNVSTPKKGK